MSYFSSRGKLFFSTRSGGLFTYLGQSNFQKIYQLKEKGHYVETFMEGSPGKIFLKLNDNQIFEITEDGVFIRKISIPKAFSQLIGVIPDKGILLANSKDDKVPFLGFGTFDENREIDSSNIKRLPLPLNKRNYFNGEILFDKEREWVWFGGEEHLCAYRVGELDILDFSSSFQQQAGGFFNIQAMLLDKQQNLWIGGPEGFSLLDLAQRNFSTLLHRKHGKAGPVFRIRGLQMDTSGLLYVNTDHGLQLVNPKTGENKPLVFHSLPTPYNTSNLLPSIRDENGHMWFGSGDGFVAGYDPATQNESIYFLPDSLPGKEAGIVWSLYKSKERRLWVGTSQGLYYLDQDKKRIEFFYSMNEFRVLAESQIVQITRENDKQLWLVTSKGLFLLDESEGVIARFGTKQGLPFENLTFLHKDSEGIFWISSRGGGLIRWDRQMGTFEQISIRGPITNDVIYSVLEDRSGYLWLSTDMGLIRFHKETRTVFHYLTRDGIADEAFYFLSHYTDMEGQIYLGGANGISVFHPDNLSPSNKLKSQQLEITAYKQLDGRTGGMLSLTSRLTRDSCIVLEPGNKSFTLKIALLDFIEPHKHLYAYRVKGFDDNWNYQLQNEITINDLPPGKYELEVKAQAANANWSENKLTIPISVKKSFLVQDWFLISCILLAAVLVVIWIHFRNIRIKYEKLRLEARVALETSKIQKDKQVIEQQARALRAMDAMKSRFFANVSHELRTPLTLILGPVRDVLARKKVEKSDLASLNLIKQNAKKLLRLVNEILDLSKLESDKLKLEEKPVLLWLFLKRLIESFESLAEYRGIHLSFSCTLEKEAHFLLDESKLEKIVSNLLSNALKFTEQNGGVELKVIRRNGSILLEVADNGRGIHPEDLPHVFDRFYQSRQPDGQVQGGTGIGLALSKELASLMQASLWVESIYGKGAKFILEFPCKEISQNYLESTFATFEEERPGQASDFEFLPSENTLSSNTRPKVLIVEDNQDMQAYIKNVLEARYQVLVAKNGVEAIQILEDRPKNEVELIISDVMMPVMDGFTLLNRLKKNKDWRPIPVILLTARAADEDRMAGLRIGIDDYILKPFQREELLARVNNIQTNYQIRKAFIESLPGRKEAETVTSVQTEELPGKKRKPKSTLDREDEKWLKKLKKTVKQQIRSFDFNINELGYHMAISRRQLSRKVKSLTGMTVNQYIQEIRMQEARRLLENRSFPSVKAIAYELGMKDVKYFSKLYIQRFGKRPSDFF